MNMKRLLLLLCLLPAVVAMGQRTSGLHIPSEKPMKPKELARAWVQPQVFCLQLQFDEGDSNYRERDLDLLDSAYNIAFDRNSPRLYTMSIEAYGDAGNGALMQARVESVYRYFTMRGGEMMPVRYAYNPIHCSCHGDTMELLRFEVPTDKQVYDCAELPDSRRRMNGNVVLDGSVVVTFSDNPEECIGGSQGCFLPQQDSNIRAYYTQLILKKGSLYSVRGTKDACPPPVEITIEEHLDYKPILDKYFLVPHRRQVILPVGYVVLHSSFNRKPEECSQTLPDSIYVRFPVTQEQMDAKLRVFAKKCTDRGCEYKALPTKKIKGGPVLMMQASLDASQLDTLFLARKISDEEISQYLYPADSPTEQGAVTIVRQGEELFYKPFKVNRKGEYEYRKSFRALLRIVAEEEESDESGTDFRNDGDEEL